MANSYAITWLLNDNERLRGELGCLNCKAKDYISKASEIEFNIQENYKMIMQLLLT